MRERGRGMESYGMGWYGWLFDGGKAVVIVVVCVGGGVGSVLTTNIDKEM